MKTEQLTRFLDSLDQKGIAGTAFAVMHEGKLVCEHYHGMADRTAGKPIGPDTIYRLFSMTKVFTNVALMQLYEKGAFILSDPLSNYLPEFADMQVVRNKPNGQVELRPAKHPIQIADIMGMTAGMTYAGADGYASQVLTENLRKLEEEKPNYTTRDYARAVAASPLAYEPGTHWRYSTAHEVVGALIEVLSGERFSEYVDRHICRPLGLRDTFFHAPKELLDARLAHLYRTEGPDAGAEITERDKLYSMESKMDRGGAGMCSTLADYLRFADTLTQGGTSTDGVRILGSETLRIMRTNRLTPEQLPDLDWPFYIGYGYGLGVRVLLHPEIAGGGNAGEFGWDGAVGTIVFMDCDKKLTAVFMEQAAPNHKAYILPRLRNLMYAGLNG